MNFIFLQRSEKRKKNLYHKLRAFQQNTRTPTLKFSLPKKVNVVTNNIIRGDYKIVFLYLVL